MNMSSRFSLLGLVFLSLALVFPASASENTGTSPRFSRTYDPICITGKEFQPFMNKEISHLGLFVAKDGKPVPIPFQVDKKDQKGKYIYEMIQSGKGWKRNPKLSDKLETNDEIAFRSADLGEKMSADKWPCPSGMEIEVTDPINQAKAYAYLLAFPETAPRSPVKYVDFTPEPLIFRSDDMSFGFTDPKHPAIMNYLTFGRDSKAPNLLNKMKMRADISFFFGKIHMRKSEQDMKCKLHAYTAGPIRVLLHQYFAMDLIAGIRSPWMDRLSINYPSQIEFPTKLYIPFSPGLVISQAQIIATWNFRKAISGTVVYNCKLREPLTVDGHMSLAELNASTEFCPWGAFVGKYGGLAYTLYYGEDFAKLKMDKNFFYRDDTDYRDEYPPIYEPGAYGEFGMKITGMENMTGGTLFLDIVLFGSKDMKVGDEQKFLQIGSHPLKVKVLQGQV